MSNYYSTSLGLILQNAGENSTTWGGYLNTNFQTLLEQAIAYQTTITMANANYTLSTTQGALNEARSAVLIITGNQNATYNVIVPSVQKVYVVTNSLNSGATAYIQVSGQASYSIPNGDTVLVYCNGTTFTGLNYVAVAGTASGLTGTPNITVGTVTSGAITSTGNLSVTGTTTLTGVATAPTPTVGDNTTKIATTAFVTSAVQAAYPVGSIYMNASNATNPATLLGFGTWVSFGAGRVMIGQDGSSFTAGATGGSADAVVVSHTHTATSTSTVTDPGHFHGISYVPNLAGGGSGGPDLNGSTTIKNTTSATTGITVSTSTTNASAGTSGTNANLQPYIVVYMWVRTV